MTKERKKPAICKPLINEEAVLRFAAAVETDKSAEQINITIPLKKEIYLSLEREASRKGRTVEEQVIKLLVKHLN